MEDRELLTRLDERTGAIVDKLDDLLLHADNGGWSRCAVRGKQIETIEKNMKEHRDSHKWFNRLVVGLVFAQLIFALFTFVSSNKAPANYIVSQPVTTEE